MATKSSGTSPAKRRKYDEAFKAEALRLASKSRSTYATARQLGISPKLLYRWQQAQSVAEREQRRSGPRPGGKRPVRGQQAAGAGGGYFKKSLGHLRPADPVSTYQYITKDQGPSTGASAPALLGLAGRAQRLPCLANGRVSSLCPTQPVLWHPPATRAEVQAEGYWVGRWRIRRVLAAHCLFTPGPKPLPAVGGWGRV